MTDFNHKHSWSIHLSSVGPDVVFCSCGAKFKPENQQIPYLGNIPKKYQ